MNSPYEIKNHPDSGDVIIKTEGDMNAIDRANEIVKQVYRTLPKGKVFAGGISKEDVDKAQAIAEEIDNLVLYSDRCHTPDEYAALLQGADAADDHSVNIPWVTLEAMDNFRKAVVKMSAAELKDLTGANTKDKAIGVLMTAFTGVRPTRLGRQARASFGRLKLARNKLSYPHPRQLKNTEEA